MGTFDNHVHCILTPCFIQVYFEPENNSLLSGMSIDGIKRFNVEEKDKIWIIGGIMENVKWEVKDNKLIIEVDLSLESGLSKSGKTITIASTKGNQKIEGTDAVIGLNVYKYPESS